MPANGYLFDFDEEKYDNFILLNVTNDPFFNKFVSSVNKYYNSDDLKEFCSSLKFFKVKEATKVYYFRIIYSLFYNKTNFDLYMSNKTENFKNLLYQIVWYGYEEVSIINLKYNLNIFIDPNSYYKSLLSEYKIFLFNNKQILSLPDEIRDLIRQYLDKPKYFNLEFFDEKPETTYYEENCNTILANIKLYNEFLIQEKIDSISSMDRIKGKTVLKKFYQYCDIKEFFNNNCNDYIKTDLLLNFIHKFNNNIKSDKPEEILKKIFENYRLDNYKFPEIRMLLPYLKSNSWSVINFNNQIFRNNIFFLLKKFSVNKWINFENFFNFIILHNFDFDLIRRYDAYEYLYFLSIEADKKYIYEIKNFISYFLYNEFLLKRLLKGMFFLLSIFGIVDIAYNDPVEFNHKNIKLDRKYLSIFDGLVAVKLTELGSYIIGLKDSFNSNIVLESSSDIILSKDFLVATLEKEDKIKRLYLQSVGEKISDFSYKIDFTTLYKDCTSTEQLLEKVKNFKSILPKEIPEIWKQFFKDIEKKLNPFLDIQEMFVLSISPDNKELLNILATDKEIKKICYKMEGFKIGVLKEDLNKLRNIIKTYGFFI